MKNNNFKKAIILICAVTACSLIENSCNACEEQPEEFIHELMTSVGTHELMAEDGHIYDLGENCYVYPETTYEVCTWTQCTADRTDDEIVDLCPLDEVCVTLKGVALDTGNEFVIVGDNEWSGHIYAVDDELMKFETYYVTLNTHWSDDVTDDSVLKFVDLETWELSHWDMW